MANKESKFNLPDAAKLAIVKRICFVGSVVTEQIQLDLARAIDESVRLERWRCYRIAWRAGELKIADEIAEEEAP